MALEKKKRCAKISLKNFDSELIKVGHFGTVLRGCSYTGTICLFCFDRNSACGIDSGHFVNHSGHFVHDNNRNKQYNH